MTRLRTILRERNEPLCEETEQIVRKATPQLWHTYSTFPSGTKHTPEHTQVVEKIAGWLLTNDILREFKDDELAFLILACHYHDLGMSGTEQDNLTAEGREQVRIEHAVSIGDRITEHWRALGFPNESTAEILSEICKGHRPKRVNGEATWNDLPEYRIVGPERDVRVRVVAAVVYAADELHIGEDRAPRREEEFKKIVSMESRRHWRRHQAIQGPVLREKDLCFDGCPGSLMFEKDLRKALRKAFLAVNELSNLLRKAGIGGALVRIRFSWNRKKIWDLLTALVCADLIPRSEKEIVEKVEAHFKGVVNGIEDLTTFCTEQVTGESVAAEIHATVSNFITRAFLTANDQGLFCLDGSPRVTEFLLGLARQADELDSMFTGKDSPQHEYELYRSEFGRRFVREQLFPRLNQDYHINLSASTTNQNLKTILESSPTASRITQQIRLPAGVLVQEDLLNLAVIAGTCADLICDPELILNADYRLAITSLVQASVERLPKFLLFVKELAVIRKLTLQQICDASISSTEGLAAFRDNPEVSLHLTQHFSASRPESSLGYLMLASRRAEVSITIQNTEAAPFTLRGLEGTELDKEHDVERPVLMTIGPGQPSFVTTTTFRARLRFDSNQGHLFIDAFKLTADDQGNPLLIQFTPSKTKGVADCRFQLIDPELTVGDIRTLEEAKSASEKKELVTIVTVEGKQLTTLSSLNLYDAMDGFYNEFTQRLATMDASLPFPFYLEASSVEYLSNCESAVFVEELAKIITKRQSYRPTLTTIFLRFSTVDSQDYYEEFLGLQPPQFGFNAPNVKGEGISQREIDEEWKAGESDFKLEMSLREDIDELAKSLRNWVSNFSEPFPFQFDQQLKFHYCQTRMSIMFDKIIDRRWYLERRVTFRFRPVSKAERYGVEMTYWEAEGDARRASLLNELFQQAMFAESTTRTAPSLVAL